MLRRVLQLPRPILSILVANLRTRTRLLCRRYMRRRSSKLWGSSSAFGGLSWSGVVLGDPQVLCRCLLRGTDYFLRRYVRAPAFSLPLERRRYDLPVRPRICAFEHNAPIPFAPSSTWTSMGSCGSSGLPGRGSSSPSSPASPACFLDSPDS